MAQATLTWIDHRPEDAERVREAMAAFDGQGMIDPLGYGTVRDAFSDMLFPGMSTVQTRARYFLFVPWTFQHAQANGWVGPSARRLITETERTLIEALLDGSDDNEGIIGRQSRGNTRTLPSAIYWGGLGSWGVRKFPGTAAELLAAMARPSAVAEFWHPHLPSAEDGWLESTPIALRPHEADFLRDRVLTSHPRTYLAHLVRDGTSATSGPAPWAHPLAADAAPHIANQLHHARLFSVAMWGAGILYNQFVSRRLEDDSGEPLPDDLEALHSEWTRQREEISHLLPSWDRADFWRLVSLQNPLVGSSTRDFVDWWLDLVIQHGDPGAAVNPGELERNILRRESSLKGPRAKLAHRRAREQAPVAQGHRQMEYRWNRVTSIVADIHEGLERA